MQIVKQIELEEALERADEFIFIDLRTAKEFYEGAILGSINIPLFDEEERARIGTVYKKSAKAARFLAMDIVAPRISKLVRRIYGKSQGKIPVAICWRGGMRSKATVQFLSMAGIDALQLRGGYRRYRQSIYQQLQDYQLKSQIIVLKGKSGTGKTDILVALAEQGYPILDLEGLANHRGSTFGGHELIPESQKNFDAQLLHQLRGLEDKKHVLVEGESKRIGNIYLPNFLFDAMRNAPVIEVEGSLEKRVERIVRDYTPTTLPARLEMYRALSRLRHRLSKANLIELKQCLDNEDYSQFVRIVLVKHYDNNYDHQLPGEQVIASVNSDDVKEAATEIAALLNKR